MGAANPYFLYPFAGLSDALDTVANTGALSGTMSYEYGFTQNYEQDLLTVPSALPIPRGQFNQLMFDITTALQQLQLYGGIPNWVSVAAGGPPTGYPYLAKVLYSGNIYQSAKPTNDNISTPGANDEWVLLNDIITPWVAYTPTFVGLGTPTLVNILSRRVGGNLEIQGSFISGTPDANPASISLGFNGVDSNVTSSNTLITAVHLCGSWTASLASAVSPTTLVAQNSGVITFGIQDATHAGTDNYSFNGGLIVNNGTRFTFQASIPVDTWPS